MEIQKYNPNSVAVFDGSEKTILNAVQSELVNKLTNDTLEDKLLDLVKQTHLIAGIKHSGDMNELNITVSEIIAEMRLNKTNIRVDEIEIAFKNGAHKKYGDYFGLNAVTFCSFIKSYVLDPNRLEAIKITKVEQPKTEPTREQKFEIGKNLALSTLQKFLEEKPIDIEGATVYRFLRKFGIVVYSEDEQVDFLEGARTIVINNKHREKFTSLDKHVRATIEKELNDVSLLETKIIHTAQHNGLVQYFQSLSFEDKPITYLTNLINEKK